MSIQDHRQDLIALFTKSLDACIAQENEYPGSVAEDFQADVRFEMKDAKGQSYQIRSRPAADFMKPYDPSASPQVRVTE